jgi:hypothetical protein
LGRNNSEGEHLTGFVPLSAGFLPSTDGDDVFTATPAEVEGGLLNGRGGNDTLSLLDGSTFDLTILQEFASIETIQGSGEHDTVILSADQVAGVLVLDGGGSPATH